MFETKGKIRTIWNSEIDLEDWKDFIEEEYPEYTDETFLFERCSNMNEIYLEDEKINLNKILNNPIIAFSSLGLWDGRKYGYIPLKNNLNNIFDISMYDETHWYTDQYDVRCKNYHHDGVNFYLFRELKDLKYMDIIRKKLFEGNLIKKDITRYTRSLKPYVKNIYGF